MPNHELVFYYSPMSSAVRVHLALEELGVPYEKVKVDFSKGETRTPEYLAKNPNGKVPFLEVDGRGLFESAAIITWLGEAYGPEKGLFPAVGTPEHRDALMWIAWATATLGWQLSRYLENASPRLPEEERNAKQAEKALVELHKAIAVLDAHLAKTGFAVGSSYTLVDGALAGFFDYARFVNVDFSTYAHVAKWLAACDARPARKAVYA